MDDHHHPNQLFESIKMHFSFQNYHCHHYYQYYVDILVLNLNETNSVCSILSLLTAIKGCISEFDIFIVERALSSQPTPHQDQYHAKGSHHCILFGHSDLAHFRNTTIRLSLHR